MNKDYIFHVNWTDRQMQPHRVGILARIDNVFYLILKNEESAKAAYNNGYNGIPAFNPDEVHTSEKGQLFEFFERRVEAKDSTEQCKELAEKGGTSWIDSFSVEEISEKLSVKYKKVILEAYELQKRKKEASQEKKADDELPDIK